MNSIVRRAKADQTSKVVTSAATLNVPDEASIVNLTGTATVTVLNANTGDRGQRRVRFIQTDTGATTFTHSDTPTAGQMYLQGDNRTVGQWDELILHLMSDGSWILEDFVG